MTVTRQLRQDSDMKDELLPGVDRTYNRISSITGQAEYCYRLFISDRNQYNEISMRIAKSAGKALRNEPYRELHMLYWEVSTHRYLEVVASYGSSHNDKIIKEINKAIRKACSRSGLNYTEPTRRRPEFYADSDIRGLIRTEVPVAVEPLASS